MRSSDVPNLPFIVADDLGFADLGCHGGYMPQP
jgi:arylsulfatase A-like enzyme